MGIRFTSSFRLILTKVFFFVIRSHYFPLKATLRRLHYSEFFEITMMRVSSLCTPRSWGVLNSLALSRRFAQRSSSLPSGSCNLSSHPATVEFDVDERIPFGNETRQRKRASVDGVWSHTEEFIRKDHDVPKVIPMLQQKESSIATNLANDDIDSSPSHITYTGGATMPLTSHLKIITSEDDTPRGVWPVYRIMVRSAVGIAPSILAVSNFSLLKEFSFSLYCLVLALDTCVDSFGVMAIFLFS